MTHLSIKYSMINAQKMLVTFILFHCPPPKSDNKICIRGWHGGNAGTMNVTEQYGSFGPEFDSSLLWTNE